MSDNEWNVVPQPHDDSALRQVLHPEIVGTDDAYAGGPGAAGTDGSALIALALAISSWLVLPVIGAIAALIVASGAHRRIRKANGTQGGLAIVRAAQVIAALNIICCLALAWLVVALLRAIF